MSLTTEELQLKISANIADASSKLKEIDSLTKKTSKSTKDMGMSFARMRDIMQGPVAAFRLVSGAINKLGAEVDKYMAIAAEAEKAQAILNSTLTATGANAWTSAAKLNEYAKTMAKVTLFEDDAVTSMQGILLGFRNIQGINFDRASTEILNMAQVMGMDLTSAAQAVGKALDNPIAGLDSLSRQGFKFSTAEKAMIKELVETNRLAEAQDIILKELSKTYGGAAAAAADTASGKYQNMKKSIRELTEAISIAMANSGEWEKIGGFVNTIADGMQRLNNTKSAAKKVKEIQDLMGTRGFQGSGLSKQADAISKIGLSADDAVSAIADLDKMLKEATDVSKQWYTVLNPSAAANTKKDIEKLEAQKKALNDVLDILKKTGTEEEKRRIKAAEAAAEEAKADEVAKKAAEDAARLIVEEAALQEMLDIERGKRLGEYLQQKEDEKALAEAYNAELQESIASMDEIAALMADETSVTVDAWGEKLDAAKAYFDYIYGASLDVFDSFVDLEKNKSDALVANLEKQREAQKEAGQDTVAIDEKIKEEKNRIGKKQFDAQKLTSIANIAISTAEAAMKAYTLDPTGFLAGIIVAAGLVQGANAAKQEYVPMAEGGMGTVNKPTLFLAGEAGPEDFAFGPKRKGGLSGSTVVNNFYGSPWAIKEAESMIMGTMARAGRGY
jgi:hypothetical protein